MDAINNRINGHNDLTCSLMSFWEILFNLSGSVLSFSLLLVKSSRNLFFPQIQLVKVNKNIYLAIKKQFLETHTYTNRYILLSPHFNTSMSSSSLFSVMISISSILIMSQWNNQNLWNKRNWVLCLLVIVMISWANLYSTKCNIL